MKIHRFFTILVVAGVIVIMSACSGFIGDGANLSITINKPSSDGAAGRFVSTDTNEVYVGLIKGRSVYFFNNFNVSGSVGTVFVGGLIPDTYILGVVLLDNTEGVVGIAVKDAKIQPGRNEISVDVGPGVTTFDLNGVDIRNPLDELGSGYTLEFREDAVVVDTRNHSAPHTIDFRPDFGAGITLNSITARDQDNNVVNGGLGPEYNYTLANTPGRTESITMDMQYTRAADSDTRIYSMTVFIK